jgi:TetR/AcrR family transcriptional regulator, lmrAB and yxaGH operons repressor
MAPVKTVERGAKSRMLESAIFLMRHSGLSGAGINQVLAHSGAPKGSMYYYFPAGKVQLTAEALKLYGGRVAAYFEATLASKRKPGAKIRALFRVIAGRLQQSNFDQSCAIGAVTLDIAPEVAALRPVVAEVMASWQAIVARHIPMRGSASARSFAGLVITAVEGGYIRGRAERSTQPLVDAGEWLARLAEESSK